MTDETLEAIAVAHLAWLREITPAERVAHLRAIRMAYITRNPDCWGTVTLALTNLIDRVILAAGL